MSLYLNVYDENNVPIPRVVKFTIIYNGLTKRFSDIAKCKDGTHLLS